MPRYETAIDLGNPNNSQAQLITLVGADRSVLDIGCGTGDRARALAARGCQVSGLDADPAAEAARDVLDELVIADLDLSPLSDHFKAESFDVVVFDSVLEHLADPHAALRDAASLLLPAGRIVVSVPNIAHAAVRLSLLAGRWTQGTGALDRTHGRYCTVAGIGDLLESCDLVIEVVRSTVVDPLETPAVTFADRLPPRVVEWVRDQPDALDHEYVVAARPLGAGEVRGPRPAVEPAVPYDTVRLRDRYSEEVSRENETRQRLLTLRDHVLGLEATMESSQRRSHRARSRAEEAERRLARARRDLRGAQAELELLRAGSPGPVRRVWRRLRRLRSGNDRR